MKTKSVRTVGILITTAIAITVIAACGAPDIEGAPPSDSTESTEPTTPDASRAVPFDPASCEGPTTLEKMDPATLPPCCDGTAHCVPKEKIPGIVRKALSECAGGFCVPDAFLLSGGAAAPTCTAFNEQPGACISKCVPEVGKNETLLKQEKTNCAAGELCAPCVHPLTKVITGVCEIGKVDIVIPPGACGDAGAGNSGNGNGNGAPPPCTPHVGPPLIDPSTLPACGAGAHCLDAKLVPPDMAKKLAACPNARPAAFCVPDDFIASAGQFAPVKCTSLGGIEGRCLNRVLPDVASQATILPQATCKAEELCTPCFHPSTGADTGACKLSCDPGPTQGPPACPHSGPDVFTPSKFPACGGSGGAHCMPSALIDAATASELKTCPGGACVPDAFIKTAGRYIAPTCTAVGGGEGRCLHASIPQIAAQASKLTQSTCASYERCAPCWDPIDGKDTGACHKSCDPGPTKPKVTFPYCCAQSGYYRGRCVPQVAIPDAEEANLSKDVCTRPQDLCVPSENLAGASFNPPSCSAFSALYFGSYQGVCLSTCLHFSGIQDTIIKQGSCDYLHQCVPCYKPLGAPTGAPGCY